MTAEHMTRFSFTVPTERAWVVVCTYFYNTFHEVPHLIQAHAYGGREVFILIDATYHDQVFHQLLAWNCDGDRRVVLDCAFSVAF